MSAARHFHPLTPPPVKPPRNSDDISDNYRDTDDSEMIPDAEITKRDKFFSQAAGLEFCPNYIISKSDNPTSTTRNISVAKWLPSGVDPDENKLQVTSCGMFLHLNVPLPIVMTDKMFPHKFGLSKPQGRGVIKTYHPKISDFEKLLMQQRARKSASIVSVAKLELPARVETHTDETMLFS